MASPYEARKREGLAYMVLALWSAVMGAGFVLVLAYSGRSGGELTLAWLAFLVVGAIALSRGFQLLVERSPGP